MSATGGTRAVVAALAANVAIAILKLGAWALTGASSMLAEGIHSIADCGNQVLLLIGGRRAAKAADAEHPFGHGRERYVFAFVVSMILFSMGGLFALYEAWHKLEAVLHPESSGAGTDLLSSRWWWVPLVVLVGAIVAESLSLRTAVAESAGPRGDQSWARFIKSAKSPELPVILLEDVAALCGLVLALFGVGMTLLTRNQIFDVIGTALIGVLLIVVAVVLAIETKSLLLGEAASPDAVRRIRATLEATDGVDRLIHMKTLHLGPEEVLVAAKIGVTSTDSAAEVAATIDRAEQAVRSAEPLVTAMYLEPDLVRPGPGRTSAQAGVDHD